MSREAHVRICGSRRVRFPPATRPLEIQMGNRFDALELEQKRALVRSLLTCRVGLWRPGISSTDRVEISSENYADHGGADGDLEEDFPGDQNGLLPKTSYSGSST